MKSTMSICIDLTILQSDYEIAHYFVDLICIAMEISQQRVRETIRYHKDFVPPTMQITCLEDNYE